MSPPPPPNWDFLAEIYRLQGIASLASTILRELPCLIPCDNVMIGAHDGTRRTLTGLVLSTPFTRSDFLAEANQSGLIAVHPFWDRLLDTRQPLKILSEMCPGNRWLENPLYRDVLREDGVRDQLNIEFGSSIADFTSVSVIRSTVGFGQHERDTLELLLPHLEQAFSNARIVEQAGIGTTRMAAIHATATLIAQDGTWIDSAVREKFRCLLGGSSQPISRLDRWLSLAVNQLNRGVRAVADFKLRLGVQTSIFHLQRDWFHRRYCLLHRFSSGPGELLGQPLSKKEHEVLFWIAEGKSNSEIATLLGISLETVKTHLKRIFSKLGVENRTAAANHAR